MPAPPAVPSIDRAATHQRGARWAPTRASDVDRERTVALLREHWLAGRLTLAELEARSEEALHAALVAGLWHALRELPVAQPAAAAPAPKPPTASAVVAFVLGVIGSCILLLSFGLLFVLSLPLTGAAWIVGRHARRRAADAGGPRGLALAGEVLGAVGTSVGCLALAGCVAIVVAA